MPLYLTLACWSILSACAIGAMLLYNRQAARQSKRRIEWAQQMQALCEKLGGEKTKRIGVRFTHIG